MVSCGSSFLWCSCKQCTGQNFFLLSRPAGWGGRKPWAACVAVGRAIVSGSLLHIIDSPSKCAHLEAWGPKAKKLGEPHSAHDSEVWRQHSFTMREEEKEFGLKWRKSGCVGGDHVFLTKKALSGNPAGRYTEPWAEVNLCTTGSGCGRAASPCHKPRLSKRRSRRVLSSTVGIFISRVWRPSESPTTHLKYLEHTIPGA